MPALAIDKDGRMDGDILNNTVKAHFLVTSIKDKIRKLAKFSVTPCSNWSSNILFALDTWFEDKVSMPKCLNMASTSRVETL